MKRKRFIALAALCCCFPIWIAAQNINLNIRNTSVRNAMEQIRRDYGYSFVFELGDVNTQKLISLNLTNQTIEAVAAAVLADQPVTFEIKNKSIIVKKTDPQPANGRTKRVNGKVTDSEGEPIIGASVRADGTTIGTVTDVEGNFSLDVPENGTHTISYIGYEDRSLPVRGRTSFSVKMAEDAKSLEEVVVIGYGSQRRSDLTGSVSSITSDRFKTGIDLTPQQIMAGAFSGVNVEQNSGKPGGSNSIRIRGGTSITASNDPLYVIDGVPISTTGGVAQANLSTSSTMDYFDQEPDNPLANLNPNDIESINVLKDASATAIYGSRGANGVIMITTKRGKKGMQSLEYNFNIGVSNVAKKLNVLSGDQYRQAAKDLGITIDDKGANTDWQDEIFRSATSTSHYLSFMSGKENTNYRASLGYSDQQGVMKGSGINTSSARVNVSHFALQDKLQLNLFLNYAETNTNQSPNSNTVGSEMGSSMFYEAYVFNPTYPIYKDDGDFYDSPPYRVNPVSFITELIDKRRTRKFIGNLNASWNFYKPLTLQMNMGYTFNQIARNAYISKNNLLGDPYQGHVTTRNTEDYSKLLETILKYNQKFGAHTVDAMLGYSYQYFYNSDQMAQAYGFLSDAFKWYSLGAASTIQQLTSSAADNKLISMYGRVNYNYDDRFLVTATLRRDGSSRFGADHKWGTFPSAAVSWRMSQEQWFKNKVVSDLKLRISYGVTGNQEIGNYNSLNTLGAGTAGYLVGGEKITIVMPQQYSNPDIKWEETAQLDLGFDFSLWDGRLRGSFDYYSKTTSDLLLRVAVPSPSYITSQIANVGEVTNKGVEVELNFDIYRNKDWLWTAGLNFSHNKNNIESLSNDKWKGDNMWTAPCQGAGLAGTYSQMIMPGSPLGTFYGRRFLGVENGKEVFANNGEPEVIGCAQPDFTYAISTALSYKNWSLNINLRGSQGNDVYNATANNNIYLSNLPGRNVLTSALTSGVDRSEAKMYSSRFIEDGSFLRLDNLTLGYTFSFPRLLISRARVFVSGQNLFVITGYSGADPEVNSEISRTGVAPLGIDYLSYPKSRTFSAGINLTF